VGESAGEVLGEVKRQEAVGLDAEPREVAAVGDADQEDRYGNSVGVELTRSKAETGDTEERTFAPASRQPNSEKPLPSAGFVGARRDRDVELQSARSFSSSGADAP
jgi:hypothetical protein